MSCRFNRAILIVPPYFMAGHTFLIFPVPPNSIFEISSVLSSLLDEIKDIVKMPLDQAFRQTILFTTPT